MNHERKSPALRLAARISAAFLITVAVSGGWMLSRWCVATNCIVPLNTSNERRFIERGKVLIVEGDYSAGETVLRRVLKFNPNNVAALKELAGQLRHRGNYAESEELFLRAINLSPDDAFLYVDIGKLYRNMHDPTRALEMFQKAALLDARQPRLWSYGYAELYITMGEFDKAIAADERALALDPNDHFTYMSLGNIYRRKEQYEKAITAYRRSIELNPRSEAYFGLGYTYIMMKKFDEAEKWFRAYIDVFDAPRGEVYAGLAVVAEYRASNFEALRHYAYAEYLDPHTTPGDPIRRVLDRMGTHSKWQKCAGRLYVSVIENTAFMFDVLGIRG